MLGFSISENYSQNIWPFRKRETEQCFELQTIKQKNTPRVERYSSLVMSFLERTRSFSFKNGSKNCGKDCAHN